MLMFLLGIIGTALCIGAYGLLTLHKISAHSMIFYVMNCVGAVLLLISIASDFDWGDFGGILIEVCWIMVSIYGMFCALKKKKEAR